MSRKRYNSGSKRHNSPKGQFNSTSPQRSSYEDSLAAECLIKAFLDIGGMEDPILKVLFIGGSKPKQGETEVDLAFRRLKSCWLEKKERTYGMREVLRMKMIEKGIQVDVNPKWAKFSIMGAPLVINPKIWINKLGEEKDFLKDFQLDIFRDAQNLSECAIRIQQYGYMNTIQTLGVKVIVHRWDQFPDKEPVICGNIDSKKIFHVLLDDLNVLHHALLHKSQIDNLESFYQEKNKNDIQLVQQDWSNYISIARGRRKILTTNQRKTEKPISRSQSIDRLSYNSVFKALEQQKQDMLKEIPIQEEKMSDDESVRSQQLIKKLRIDSLSGVLIQPQSVVEKELAQILAIEEVFNKYNALLKTLNQDEIDLIPKEIFQNGLTSFVADNGCNSYLKLFLNLNWLQLKLVSEITREEFLKRRNTMFREISLNFVSKQKPRKLEKGMDELNGLINGLQSSVDIIYEGTDIQVFYEGRLQPKYCLVRVSEQPKAQLYWYEIPEDQDKVIWHIIVEKFKRCLIKEELVGLARISMDDIMICPLCEASFSWQDIFKHSCPSTLAVVKIPQGWPK